MSEMVQPYGQSPAEATAEPGQQQPLAPAWHTAALVLIVLGTSASGYFTSRRYVSMSSHGAEPPQNALLATYGATLVLEWFLFFFARWGERMREAMPRSWFGPPLRARIGGSWRTGKELWRDIAIAVGVWIGFLIIEGVLGILLKPQGGEVVRRLVPHTGAEMALWVPVAISAGFCEEYVFRGYFQRQLGGFARSVWAGLVLQAALFGVGHGYQGPKLMLIIFCAGLFFGIVAKSCKSLRPTMLGHGWADFISGLGAFILSVTHHL